MNQPEQSVEDILDSIKRMMAEETPPSPSPSPRRAADPGDDDVLELTRPIAPPPPRAPSAADPGRTIVSAGTADASRQALAYLSSLKLRSGDVADDSLAGLVRELLKPMLKAWLDVELPAIVERAVVQEIARMTAARD